MLERPKPICATGVDAARLRKRLGLNQAQFWNKLGVTQSGGSRYENGRGLPDAVMLLLHISYADEKHAQRMLEWLRLTE